FIGFKQPTPEIMQSWTQWIKSVEDKVADMGNGLSQGKEITKNGTKELPMDLDAITAYMVFNAKNFDEAEKIAQSCPMITSVKVYEVRLPDGG
ncbi:unnamed protein product, partial [marine sediment metagenome]